MQRFWTTTAIALALGCAQAQAQEAGAADSPPISFEADSLDYNDTSEIVTARGNVMAARNGYRLQADEVIYNRTSGSVEARGNVRMWDPEGNLARAERAELTDTLKDGVVYNLLLMLDEGTRLAAGSGLRADPINRFERVVYSPCAICVDDKGEQPPVWRIKARRVTYDETRKRFYFEGARLEMLGVPVLFTPGLSTPAPDVKRATGLLGPNFYTDAELGVGFDLPVFIALSPQRDLTVTPTFYSGVTPLLGLEYREQVSTGVLTLGGTATYTAQRDAFGNRSGGNELRGYLYYGGLLQHAPRWRSTISGSVSTDDTFLRRYNINEDDTLRSNYRLEYFGDRSYFAANLWGFRGLRLTDQQGLIPFVLPQLDYRWASTPDPDWGQVSVRANTLSIFRSDGGDTNRGSLSVQWRQTRYGTWGQVWTTTALGRGDVYSNTRGDRLSVRPEDAGETGWFGRVLPTLATTLSLPLAGPALGGVQTFEPIVQLVVAPNTNNSPFPNEDSRAFDLDSISLFEIDRAPGLDRVEGGGRVTYGLRWSLDQRDWQIRTEVGQSYRLYGDSPFLDGTGLPIGRSDIVGRTSLRFRDWVDLIHRYRLDRNSLAIRRNEIDLRFGTARTFGTIGYSKLNRDILNNELEDRAELRLSTRVQIAKYWSMFSSSIIDVTRSDALTIPQQDGFAPIRQTGGISYEDECFAFSVGVKRNFTQDRDFERGTTVLIRLAFKTVGGWRRQ